MLTIDWPGTDAEGWTGHIPMEWFAKVCHVEDLSHSIYNPGKRPLQAKLSINVGETDAVLNYCGKHKAFNEKHRIEPGLIKIIFRDAKRKSIDAVLWKDDEDDPEWVDSWAVIGFTEEVFGADEGGKRLAVHMRSERIPWLAAEKKVHSKDASERLACEACGPDLNDIYGCETAYEIYEVHHRKPVSNGPQRVTLDDLAILCPNCHRAIHRTKPMMSVEAFRKRLKEI